MQILESLLKILVLHGKAVAQRLDTCPLGGLALPIGLNIRKFRPGYFQGASALARLVGLQLHPVPFRNLRGDAAKFYFV